MSAVREINAKDTLQNKIFRVIAFPFILDVISAKLTSMWQDSSVDNPARAKNISEIQEAIAYEEFPALSTIIQVFAGR